MYVKCGVCVCNVRCLCSVWHVCLVCGACVVGACVVCMCGVCFGVFMYVCVMCCV